MLLFIIFSPISGTSVVQLRHEKNCTTLLDQKALDPYILISMAKSLYIIGTELQSGGLKELDLTQYSLMTHLDSDFLLIIGVENHPKHKKKIILLKEAMGNIHREFLQVVEQSKISESFSSEAVIQIL
ncbi:MAG: hypothetical protein E4G98_06260, partial [Promethearchaeota archaeon]